MLTQSITTAVLFATGDSMAQQLVEKKGLKNHELARTGRMALYGGGLSLSSKSGLGYEADMFFL
jgi:protein Mpv17